MRKNKYIPLIIAIVLGGIIASFFMGGDDGKYVVSSEERPLVKSCQPTKIKLNVKIFIYTNFCEDIRCSILS